MENWRREVNIFFIDFGSDQICFQSHLNSRPTMDSIFLYVLIY